METKEATVKALVIDAIGNALGDDYLVDAVTVQDIVDFYEEMNEGSYPALVDPDAVVNLYNYTVWVKETKARVVPLEDLND